MVDVCPHGRPHVAWAPAGRHEIMTKSAEPAAVQSLRSQKDILQVYLAIGIDLVRIKSDLSYKLFQYLAEHSQNILEDYFLLKKE